jgi:hypothetical protein
MCSEKIEKNRLRRATFFPVLSQNRRSSGRQSSIHLPDLSDGGPGGAGTVVGAVSGSIGVRVNRVGAAMRTTVATAGYPGVALRLDSCSVSLTTAASLW